MKDRHHLRAEPEAELVIIGSLLLSTVNGDGDCRELVFAALSQSDFFDPAIRRLFGAAKQLHDRGEGLDQFLWLNEVESEMPRAKAASLLLEAGASTATTTNVQSYIRIVQCASQQRQLVCVANDLLNAARTVTQTTDISELIDRSGEKLAVLRRGQARASDLTNVGAVFSQPIEWLWPGRVAIGKLTLLVGDPGLGKSLVTLDMAARVSRGLPWPDATDVHQPVGRVLLLSAEDDLADTIRPRLDAHGANVSHIHSLRPDAGMGQSFQRLRVAAEELGDCRLIVIDPLSAFLGRADSHNNAEVREAMAPLQLLASDLRVAVLAVTHFRKGDGAAIHKSMGSMAFVAAARATWAVVKDPRDPRRRLVLSIKNNLASDSAATGMAYAIDTHDENGSPRVFWEPGPVTISADEALNQAPKRRPGPAADELHEAEVFLQKALSGGPQLASEVIDEAVEVCGHSKRTLDRARKSIGVEAYRPDPTGKWWWRLTTLPGCQPFLLETTWQPGNVEKTSRILNENAPANGHIAILPSGEGGGK